MNLTISTNVPDNSPLIQQYDEMIDAGGGRIPTALVNKAKALILEIIKYTDTDGIHEMSDIGFKSLIFQIYYLNRHSALKIAKERISNTTSRTLARSIIDIQSIFGDGLDILANAFTHNNTEQYIDYLFMSQHLVFPAMRTMVLKYIVTSDYEIPYSLIVSGIGKPDVKAYLIFKDTNLPVGDVPISAEEFSVLSRLH